MSRGREPRISPMKWELARAACGQAPPPRTGTAVSASPARDSLRALISPAAATCRRFVAPLEAFELDALVADNARFGTEGAPESWDDFSADWDTVLGGEELGAGLAEWCRLSRELLAGLSATDQAKNFAAHARSVYHPGS